MESRLAVKILENRLKGLRIRTQWVKREAVRLKATHSSADKPFKCSDKWLLKFKHRNELSVLQINNRNPRSSDERITQMLTFHAGVLDHINVSPFSDETFGRYNPRNIFNVDQVPLTVAYDRGTTWDA